MILDGKIVALSIYENLKNEISKLEKKPKLGAILVGDNPSSIRYINQKRKWAEYIGMDFELFSFEKDINEENLIEKINFLNNNSSVNGFIVQLPLPDHINEEKVINLISPTKDVDGFHPVNQGKIVIGDETGLKACTPAGVIELCKYYGIEISGKNVVIIGRSNIVGKPLANLFINLGATLTICNSKTQDINFYTKNADIIVTAMGVAKFLKSTHINKTAKIIDVGFSVIDDKIYGDCDFEDIKNNGNDITPVPGGVGAMTVAMLLTNTFNAYKNQKS